MHKILLLNKQQKCKIASPSNRQSSSNFIWADISPQLNNERLSRTNENIYCIYNSNWDIEKVDTDSEFYQKIRELYSQHRHSELGIQVNLTKEGHVFK